MYINFSRARKIPLPHEQFRGIGSDLGHSHGVSRAAFDWPLRTAAGPVNLDAFAKAPESDPMRRPTSLAAVITVLAMTLASCSDTDSSPKQSAASAPQPSATGTPGASPTTQAASTEQDLRDAATAYSDGFLTGKPETYDLLSSRCQSRVSEQEFGNILEMASATYGGALPFETFDATISGDLARVSYTYSVPAINQESEPWVREDGAWKQDDC